jgi:hypothetical protein
MEDPIAAIENAGYTNLVESFVGADAYSYVYDGQAGYLDHALASAALTPQVTGVVEWHINADEPAALDYNNHNQPALYNADPFRASDHDPLVETATGSGIATFESDKGTIEDLAAVAEGTLPAEGKPDLDFPHGFFSFNITDLIPCQHETVVVTITLPSTVPVGTEYWKYHASEGGWIQIPMAGDDGDNVITITLVDGGLGDDDGVCNGVIVDQGGPGQPPLYTLTVNKAGGGTGTVTSNPPGIFCGADCTENYVQGTLVTLAAHPGVKSYFIGWGGDCDTDGQVTMDSDKTCTATFGYPVGGIVVPVDKLGLLAPWMGMVALAGLAILGGVVVRKRGG